MRWLAVATLFAIAGCSLGQDAQPGQPATEQANPLAGGPLGSELLRAKNKAESERDKEAVGSDSRLLEQQIRDARSAEQQADAAFKEHDAQTAAKATLEIDAVGIRTERDSAVSDAQLSLSKARAAALARLIKAKKQLRQDKVAAAAAAIKSSSQAQHAALETWQASREQLRDDQLVAIQTAEQLLQQSTEAARAKREKALDEAIKARANQKAEALRQKQARSIEIQTAQQLAVGQSFEAKALALKHESPQNYTSEMHDAYLRVIEEGGQDTDQATLDDQHNAELDMLTKAQQDTAKHAADKANRQLEELAKEYASALVRADNAGEQAVQTTNSDFRADLDLAKQASVEQKASANSAYTSGMAAAAETKDKALATITETKKKALEDAESELKAKSAALDLAFETETKQLEQKFLNSVHQAHTSKNQKYAPLYKEYNSEKERAAREKAATFQSLSISAQAHVEPAPVELDHDAPMDAPQPTDPTL